MRHAILGAMVCGAGALLAVGWLVDAGDSLSERTAAAGQPIQYGAASTTQEAQSDGTGRKQETASSHAGVAAGRRPHILLITLDTLRADHLGCYGYFRDTSPHLDALARESIVFDRAIAPMATTFPVHLSMMTGVLPIEHGFTSNTRLIDEVFVPTEALQTVAQKLAPLGYRTAAFVSAAPVRDSTGLGAGFDDYNQPAVDSWKLDGIRRAEDTNKAVFDWIGAHVRPGAGQEPTDGKPDSAEPNGAEPNGTEPPPSESAEPRASARATAPDESRPQPQDEAAPHAQDAPPLFVWIHYFDPHWPYDPPPPFDAKFTTDDPLKAWLAERRITESFPDKWKNRTAADIHNEYDGEIAYLDHHLGELFSRWRSAGLWEQSIVIVAADHGEGLGQHDWPAHGRIFGEQIHVPLIVRVPWNEPRQPSRIDSILSLADVFPTVFELCGPPLDRLLASQATATSVFAPRDFPHMAFSQRSDKDDDWEPGEKFALTMDGWRYYHLTEGADELYNLSTDPHELRNVIAEEPDMARLMKQRIVERIAASRSLGRRIAAEREKLTRPAPDPGMKGALSGLGYTEADEDDPPPNDNRP